MNVITVATFLVGGLCLLLGPRFSCFALLVSMLLGASAALKLGGASLQPAYVLLGFVLIDLARRRKLVQIALRSLMPPDAGFWFLVTLSYGIISALIMPRLFAGATDVFAIGKTDLGTTQILSTPLAPVSGNVTQSLYFAADFLCFLTFSAYAASGRNLLLLAKAVIVCTLTDVAFAVIDLVTYYTNTTELLAFMRNADYSMLVGAGVNGFKRIVGSFPEASTFAGFTIGLFAATLNFWMYGVYARAAGLAAAASFICLLFCTSSGGYFGLVAFLACQYVICFMQIATHSAPRNASFFIIGLPFAIAVAALAVFSYTPAFETVSQLIDATLTNKLDSDSGIERASWNAQAMQAFWATSGLGAGIGSVRSSSWIVAVLSSIGVLGAIPYFLFLLSVFFGRLNTGSGSHYEVRQAARMGCLAQLLLSTVAAGSVDLGLEFYILAAVAIPPPTVFRRTASAARLVNTQRRMNSRVSPESGQLAN